MHTSSLTSDFVGCLPVNHPFLRGTFEPVDTVVDVHVAVSARIAGLATVNLAFTWGVVDPPGGPLREAGQYHPLRRGARRRPVGKLSGEGAGSVSRQLRLDGLVPAARYTWALEYSVVSGYDAVDLGPSAAPDQVVLAPDERCAYVGDPSGRVWPVELAGRPGWSYRQEPYPSRARDPIETGGKPAGLATTPHGKRLVVCDAVGERVLVVETASRRIRRRVRLPRGARVPAHVVCAGEADVWIGCDDEAGHLCRLDLTGDRPQWSSTVATGGPLSALATDPAHDVLFWLRREEAVLGRRSLATGATSEADAGGTGTGLAVAADAVWAGLRRPDELRCFDPATLSSSATVRRPGRGAVADVAVSGDGKLVFIVTAAPARMEYASTHVVANDGLPPRAWFDGAEIGTVGRSIRLTTDNAVVLTADTKIHHWPSATFRCEPAGGGLSPEFWDDFAEVRFAGVRATG